MKTILITREEKLDKSLEKIAKEKGFKILYCPLIKTQIVDFEIPDLEKYEFLIITSKNALKYFLKKVPLENVLNKKVIAVGDKTKKYLQNLGFKEIIVPQESSAKGIEKLLNEERFKNKKFLFIRAEKGQKIKNENTYLLIVYKTVFNRPDTLKECEKLIKEGKIDYILFSSPSTFYSFKKSFKDYKEILNKLKIVAIGNTTKKAIEEEGFKVYFTPKKPSFENIINEL